MASTQIEVQDELLTRIKSLWDTHANGAPLYYDNQDVDRPDSPTLFGRAIVRHGRGTRTTLGINRFRRFGTVYVQIFVPQGTGTITIRDLSDDIAHGLEDVPSSFGVRLQDVDINELGSDGVYFQVNISADFTYDRQAA
tara:strand:- start:112 stop:528 length:417 start_codon:yes stop_codon:yes gene_type:complete